MRRAGRTTPRVLLAALVPLLVTGGIAAARADTLAAIPDACAGRHWVTTWATAPQDAAGPFTDRTFRSIVTASAGGTAVRVTLSNRFGSAPVTFDDVHVALRRAGAAVDPSSVRAVTFAGRDAVEIAPGDEARSDPVRLSVPAGADLAVSHHVVGPAMVDRHLQAIQTSYLASGRHGSDTGGDAFAEAVTSWHGLVAVDVLAPRSTGALAVLGDSITEGVGSTVDAGRRWPDLVARRAGGELAVLNAGIGGNHAARPFALSGPQGLVDFGPAATSRFPADVLRRSGVTDVVVFIGINDVFTQLSPTLVEDVTGAYRRMALAARAAGLRVIGATITPASQSGVVEDHRLAINRWIRGSGVFDAVVDFDAAVADPASPNRLVPRFDADRVHLTDAGYAALAEAFDHESLLQGTGCRS